MLHAPALHPTAGSARHVSDACGCGGRDVASYTCGEQDELLGQATIRCREILDNDLNELWSKEYAAPPPSQSKRAAFFTDVGSGAGEQVCAVQQTGPAHLQRPLLPVSARPLLLTSPCVCALPVVSGSGSGSGSRSGYVSVPLHSQLASALRLLVCACWVAGWREVTGAKQMGAGSSWSRCYWT